MPGSVEGHEAGDDGQEPGPPYGVPIPAARPQLAGNSGLELRVHEMARVQAAFLACPSGEKRTATLGDP
jgi:hypothetical protein